jgi:tetratricopeptide (TPR) repeat protein/photosystem II stability/assembly factor-like uncharacterized protein
MAAVTDPLNPYIAGSPVTDAKMFFGREDIFDWIQHSLAGQFADHILVIHGQRRVGKTSVLKQLPHRLPDRYIPVFFDLQGRTRTTLDRFLWWLAREIVRVLKQDRELILPLPEQEAFAQDLEYLESHFLPELRRQLPDHTLLLTFDEFDTLEEEEARETLGQPLTETLRRLMGREGLNFIFSIGSSGRKLENMQASYTEFFKAALYKKVSFLGQQEAYNLITRPVEGVLEYQPAAVRAIYEITSGHPYFTQLVCHELFALCQRTAQRTVSAADVSGVLDEVVERGTVNLKFVWDEAGELERWTLAGLAHSGGEMNSRALGDFLRKQRVRFSPPDLEAALIHLREKDVLTAQNTFVNHLLRRWLQRNRPLEQVREELTEVNPIANRYIEIGLEYLDSGLHEKAIQSFQEALEVDTDNLPALVHIGQAHLRQQAYAEAVSQFEQALSLDEEDVAARAGLCQANLALGDQASTKGKVKEAQRSYQQILAINPEHTDARQRMADIHRQQAEKSLAEHKDEEALSAFRQALAFTPEDEALEARVLEVQEQKRAAVLSTLRERSDQALREQRWEQAAAALQDALALQPDDPGLLGKLAEARSGLRKSQQAAARARAGSLEKAERWDEALQAWGEYLALGPADREAAQGEIARIEKARSVAQSYAQAQAALAKKDYDNAVSLLKAIVIEDEGYKGASRLMAEAIELRRARRRIWQSNWVRLGIAGVVLAGLAALFVWVWPRISTPPEATAAPTAAGAAPSGAAPTQASRPAVAVASPTSQPVPTAIPLAWARLSSGQFLPRDVITAIVFDPSDAAVLYVGTANAGIYRSIDAGQSWQPAHNGLGGSRITALLSDSQSPGALFAGIAYAEGAIYRTRDGGASWEISLPCAGDRFCWPVLAPDPADGRHVYAFIWEMLYETLDGGEDWTQVNESTCPDSVAELTVDPNHGSTLYARAYESDPCDGGVYRSEDGGRSWAITGIARADIYNLRVEAGPEGYLYIQRYDGLSFASGDRGGTWEQLPRSNCGPVGVRPEGGAMSVCDSRVTQTADGGQTWEDVGPAPLADVRLLAVSPHDPEVILAGGQGVAVSTDRGVSWVDRNAGLPASGVELKVDQVEGEGLFVHPSGEFSAICGPLYRSPDGGKSWAVVFDQGCGLQFDANGQMMYRFDPQTLYRSSDRGATWESLPIPFQADRVVSHPAIEQHLFGFPLDGERVMASVDGGETWQQLNDQTVEWMSQVSLFSNPARSELLYLVPHYGAYRSEDGGQTWGFCDFSIEWTSLTDSRWVIDPRDDEYVYAARLGRGLATSRDGCRQWSWLSGFPRVNVNSLAIDPVQPDTLYAGSDSGAYVSFDAGLSWGEINDGLLGATVVYSIVIDPQGVVYAATPYGIFRLEG